ncbi:MAG: hypothetical protein ACYDAO_00810 [Thermoplasmataceae archaeon]
MHELIDKLDWKLCISLEPETDFSEISKKLGVKTELGIHFLQDSTEITLFFPREIEQERELRIFLQEFHAVERSGICCVKRIIKKTTKFFDMIHDLLRIPSVVMIDSWMKNGIHRVEFIFNSKEIFDVSDILTQQISTLDKAFIEFLGPCEGFGKVVSSIDTRTKLSLIDIELTPPEDVMSMETSPIGDSWVYMSKMPYGFGEAGGIYFTSEQHAGTGKFVEITEGVLYTNLMKNPYIEYIEREMNSRGILSLFKICEFHKPVLRLLVLIPVIFQKEFFIILSSSLKDFVEWNPLLKRLKGVEGSLEL